MDKTLIAPLDDPKSGRHSEAKEVRFGYIESVRFIESPKPPALPRMTVGRDVVADIKQAMRGA